jgi:hypothetical protein
MKTFLAAIVRVIALAVALFLLYIVGHWAIIGLYGMMVDPVGTHSVAMVIIVQFIAGLALAAWVLNLRVGVHDRQLRISFGKQQAPSHKAEAIEPEALRLRDMIALLDEDDLDDLRAEVRETLRERIHRLSADESETFEELLSDSKRKRR